MSKRKYFTPEQKVAIVRRHLLEGVPANGCCWGFCSGPSVGSSCWCYSRIFDLGAPTAAEFWSIPVHRSGCTAEARSMLPEGTPTALAHRKAPAIDT